MTAGVWLTLVWPVCFDPHGDDVGAVLIQRVDIPENKLQLFTFATTTKTFGEFGAHFISAESTVKKLSRDDLPLLLNDLDVTETLGGLMHSEVI